MNALSNLQVFAVSTIEMISKWESGMHRVQTQERQLKFSGERLGETDRSVIGSC